MDALFHSIHSHDFCFFSASVPLFYPQSERGNRPPIELVRRPSAVGGDPTLEDWAPFYLEQRQAQLASTLKDVMPHKPEFDGLIVRGVDWTWGCIGVGRETKKMSIYICKE